MPRFNWPFLFMLALGNIFSTGAQAAEISANNAQDSNTMPDYNMCCGGSIYDDSLFGFNSSILVGHTIQWVSVQFDVTSVDANTSITNLLLGFNNQNPTLGNSLAHCSLNNFVPTVSQQPNTVSCVLGAPFTMSATTSYYVGFTGTGTLHLSPAAPQATLSFADAVPSPEPASLLLTGLGIAFLALRRRR